MTSTRGWLAVSLVAVLLSLALPSPTLGADDEEFSRLPDPPPDPCAGCLCKERTSKSGKKIEAACEDLQCVCRDGHPTLAPNWWRFHSERRDAIVQYYTDLALQGLDAEKLKTCSRLLMMFEGDVTGVESGSRSAYKELAKVTAKYNWNEDCRIVFFENDTSFARTFTGQMIPFDGREDTLKARLIGAFKAIEYIIETHSIDIRRILFLLSAHGGNGLIGAINTKKYQPWGAASRLTSKELNALMMGIVQAVPRPASLRVMMLVSACFSSTWFSPINAVKHRRVELGKICCVCGKEDGRVMRISDFYKRVDMKTQTCTEQTHERFPSSDYDVRALEDEAGTGSCNTAFSRICYKEYGPQKEEEIDGEVHYVDDREMPYYQNIAVQPLDGRWEDKVDWWFGAASGPEAVTAGDWIPRWSKVPLAKSAGQMTMNDMVKDINEVMSVGRENDMQVVDYDDKFLRRRVVDRALRPNVFVPFGSDSAFLSHVSDFFCLERSAPDNCNPEDIWTPNARSLDDMDLVDKRKANLREEVGMESRSLDDMDTSNIVAPDEFDVANWRPYAEEDARRELDRQVTPDYDVDYDSEED